jgi:hypothetical protein
MTSSEQTVFDAHINTLDNDTARRVAILVVECHASIPLALQAVQAANDSMRERTYTSRTHHYSGGSRSS